MQIYRASVLIVLLSLVSFPCWGDTRDLSRYILQRQGTEAMAHSAIDMDRPFKKCFQTPTNLICVDAGKYPNIQNNANAKMAVLNGLALSAKYALAQEIATNYPDSNYNNREAASVAIVNGIKSGSAAFALKGAQFATFTDKDWCAAVASIPLNSLSTSAKEIYNHPEFAKDYCQILWPRAKELMNSGNYADALIILKELHDLKFGNMDAYIMAANAFYMQNKPKEAEKITLELFNDYKSQLTPEQMKEIGDLLSVLGLKEEAENAYKLSEVE